nr:hypothetical protein CFP56_21859 [Quercus suber]
MCGRRGIAGSCAWGVAADDGSSRAGSVLRIARWHVQSSALLCHHRDGAIVSKSEHQLVRCGRTTTAPVDDGKGGSGRRMILQHWHGSVTVGRSRFPRRWIHEKMYFQSSGQCLGSPAAHKAERQAVRFEVEFGSGEEEDERYVVSYDYGMCWRCDGQGDDAANGDATGRLRATRPLAVRRCIGKCRSSWRSRS